MDTKADVYLPQSCDGNKVFHLKNWIFVQGPKNANFGGIILKRRGERITGVSLDMVDITKQRFKTIRMGS